MSSQNLTKFVQFMRNYTPDSEMELINLGKSLGLDLFSFKKLRNSQNGNFIDAIRENAFRKMKSKNENKVKKGGLFFVGSIDFMISKDKKGEIKYFLLEANGGSSRGLSILTPTQQQIIYQGYLEAIDKALKKKKKREKKILILIGIPVGDGLIHEKALMISYLRENLEKRHLTIGLSEMNSFTPKFSEDVMFLIVDYKQLSKTLSYKNNWIKFNGNNVDVLIGDGVSRRLTDDDFKALLINNLEKLNTIIVNPIYLITDDKSLAYLAKHLVNQELKKYNNAKFLFTKAVNEKELTEKIQLAVNQYNRAFIIKPYGGSGGVGVMSIFPEDIRNNTRRVKEIITQSQNEFYRRFMDKRSPFPYTIQEMANFSLIDWRGGKHTFDIRIYLSQIQNKIIPVGGLARIARGDFIRGMNKEEFVVNLSGFDGRIEVDRGLGFSEKATEFLGLDSDDFIDLFCNSSIIFKSIIENYQKIVKFDNWDKIIGPD
ncbi:MAG: hypothetical protein ACQERB_06890 [Promethearchaeati archaeon]